MKHIQQALPQSQKDQHDKVFVLSMNRSNDNMGVAPLSQELEYVLTSLYGFYVKHIPLDANLASGNVEFEFNKYVSTFVNNRASPEAFSCPSIAAMQLEAQVSVTLFGCE